MSERPELDQTQMKAILQDIVDRSYAAGMGALIAALLELATMPLWSEREAAAVIWCADRLREISDLSGGLTP